MTSTFASDTLHVASDTDSASGLSVELPSGPPIEANSDFDESGILATLDDGSSRSTLRNLLLIALAATIVGAVVVTVLKRRR